MVRVLNAKTFNDAWVISWQSVLFLVKEIRVPGKSIEHLKVTDKLYHIMLYRVPFAISVNRTHSFRGEIQVPYDHDNLATIILYT
jgi:hypothetical protein